MTVSMMLQSKILKTKKRLFEQDWFVKVMIISLMGLVTVLAYAVRSTTMSGSYGIIGAEIPVMSVPPEDKAFNNFKEHVDVSLASHTPVVLMTSKEFIFGDMEAFGPELAGTRNKFSVPHVDGIPDLSKLLDDMRKWYFARMSAKNLSNDGLLVLVPTSDIPMSIVIQVMSELKKSPFHERVILGGGLI